jgi:hypothetical protein
MKLARLEHELNKPINWGAIQFQHLQEREALQKASKLIGLPSVPPPNASIRIALEQNASTTGPINGTSIIASLNEEEQTDFFSRFPFCEVLNLTNWSYLSEVTCRCISITCGIALRELDFSNSAVCVNHLEIILVRTTNLKILRLNNCERINSLSIPIIVRLLSKSLLELYTNSCPGMKTECFSQIAGSINKSANLKKLRAFDLGDCPLNDRSVITLAEACHQLKFLNLRNGYELTDSSIICVAHNCSKMAILNLSGCGLLTTKSLCCIAAGCTSLVSLNIAKCTKVGDKAVVDLSRHCPRMQAANFAGLKKLTEDAIYALATNCPALLMLNVTGCERITVNGLNALIEGLVYVVKGISFMGFRPKDEHIEKKLSDQLNAINNYESVMLQKQLVQQNNEERRIQQERFVLENKSASIITDYIHRYRLRMHFYRAWRRRLAINAALLVQRLFRGFHGRILALQARKEREHFQMLWPYALIIQQHTRGHLCRLKNARISRTIREMYLMRKQECYAALAVRLQSHGRRYLATHKTRAWAELRMRRRFNMQHAATTMQRLGRKFVAIMRVERRRKQKLSFEMAIRSAQIKIKEFLLFRFRRWKGKLSGEELKKFFRHKWGAAIKIQNNYRRYRQREIYNKISITIALYHRAATSIQRVFRGRRVLNWRDMRLNVIAAFALDRQFLERKDAIAASRLRYKKFVAENQADSASEPDDDDEDGNDMEIPWHKSFDAHSKRIYWQNMITNEITYEEPVVPLAHEKSMIGKRIKVFWTAQVNLIVSILIIFPLL